MRRKRIALVLLVAVVISSSFGVVITRHHVRMAFIHSEELLRQQDELHLRWESLQLEHGALLTESRVETIAKNRLGMKTPARDEIVTLMVEGGEI